MFSDISIYRLYYDWWKNIDKVIFLLIVILFILGLFFSLASTSLIASDKLETNSYFFFFKHFIYFLIGMTILIFFSSLSEKNLFKFLMPLKRVKNKHLYPREIIFTKRKSCRDILIYFRFWGTFFVHDF